MARQYFSHCTNQILKPNAIMILICIFKNVKKNDTDIKKSDLEQKYQIITSYPAKMSKSELQQDLDLLGVPDNGTVTDADFQDIVNIINNAAGHPNVGNFD